MATNADPAVDDSKPVTEDDLRALKYGTDDVETPTEDETVETTESTEADDVTGEEIGQTDDQASDETEEHPLSPPFVKEFAYIKGDTPEEYARNLEQAYKNSSTEALRLKSELDKAPSVTPPPKDPDETTETPANELTLWAKQQLDKEIKQSFDTFRKEYPQVSQQADYDQFTRRVNTLSRTILADEKRLAAPDELYRLAAASLGWQKQSEPDAKDKLGMALKDSASTSKTASGPAKASPKSKVTQAMIEVNRKMYPGKTDDEIRKELEPYVQ